VALVCRTQEGATERLAMLSALGKAPMPCQASLALPSPIERQQTGLPRARQAGGQSALVGEEVLEEGRALVGEDPADDGGPVVESRVTHDVPQ
jgi:hypothetical protein